MNEGSIRQTLSEFFVGQLLGIEGLVLVSSQGQPLTPPIGLDEDTTLILAGTMLHLGGQVQDEFQWQEIEQISMRSREGYISLVPCTEDVFLLVKVKTANTPIGFIEQDIKRMASKLQAKLKGNKDDQLSESSPSISRQDRQWQDLGVRDNEPLDLDFISYCQQELAEFIGPIATMVCQRVLTENPGLTETQYVEALTQQIPSQQQAVEFQQRVRSSQ